MGKAFLNVLADSIGRASGYDSPVYVVDESYVTVDKDARYETADKPAIPTMSEWGMATLVLVLMAAGVLTLLRKQSALRKVWRQFAWTEQLVAIARGARESSSTPVGV